MTDALIARHEFAIDLAREAGTLASEMRHTLGSLEAKESMDYATSADHAVEALIRRRIGERFGDAVIGEEDGGVSADLVWVVDPIDGTVNYLHGMPRWCVSIALVADGDVVSGVIHAPDEGRLFAARRNAGAFLNGAKASVSRLRHGASPLVEVGWSPRRPIAQCAGLIQRLIGEGIEFRRLGSGALGVADTAVGLNDGYLELHINAWDVLAGLALVREAGGWCNDFLAGDGLMRGNPVVVCTPEITARLGTAAEIVVGSGIGNARVAALDEAAGSALAPCRWQHDSRARDHGAGNPPSPEELTGGSPGAVQRDPPARRVE